MFYVASPYTDPDPSVRRARHAAAVDFLVHAVRIGLPVYSPIAHWHGATVIGNLRTEDWAWRDINAAMLRLCSGVIVLAIPGWQESAGVKHEIAVAEAERKEIRFYKRQLDEPVGYVLFGWDWISKATAVEQQLAHDLDGAPETIEHARRSG